MHVVMTSRKQVLWICQKKDISKLFTREFFNIYQIWWYFHKGLGLPYGKHYMEHDSYLIDCVMAMETHFDQEFSFSHIIIQYLEAIIKNIHQLAKITAKK